MKQRRVQRSDLFETVPPRIELSALQRAQARALLEVLLAEAIGETLLVDKTSQREVSHDENNS
jgi:hypothetical protein